MFIVLLVTQSITQDCWTPFCIKVLTDTCLPTAYIHKANLNDVFTIHPAHLPAHHPLWAKLQPP